MITRMEEFLKTRDETIYPGADESTPSYAHYFSWINNTNEGATEEQTLKNLDFFAFLRREYGMVLDIYAFDCGALDGPSNKYGKFDSEKSQYQWPNGWGIVHEKAKSIGCRLGLWGGPDGFGDTEASAQDRINLISGLCRDYDLLLLKVDGVGGQLRPEKQKYFVEMMQQSRAYSPDLILLNHRLDLGLGGPYTTTYLMEGLETYVDVSMCNQITGTHNRVQNLSRSTPPDLFRLQEDHGVCLSSCMDFWDDDLILQAFNRALILAPELYGNPWFLRDDEYPKLARIFNLHRRYKKFLFNGAHIDESIYGPKGLTRGDGENQFLTLRNLTWEPATCTISLNAEIGLLPTESKLLVRQFHPTEKIIGLFSYNDRVDLVVAPFRACLISVSPETLSGFNDINSEIGVMGCDYEIIKDLPGKPVELVLNGMPGNTSFIQLHSPLRSFSQAFLDGQEIAIDALFSGDFEIKFQGEPLQENWHRKITNLTACAIPDDAEMLYEATCFAATNNCLEVRSLERSGPTRIPEVQAARDAFFNQVIFKIRGAWDKYAFDGDDSTRWYCPAPSGLKPLRIDFGEILDLECFVVKGSEDDFEDEPEFALEVSADLKNWERITGKVQDCYKGTPENTPDKIYHETSENPDIPFDARNDFRFAGEGRLPFPVGDQKFVEFDLGSRPVRYLRLLNTPLYILDANGKRNGTWMDDRSKWRANYRFKSLNETPIVHAWKTTFTMDEIARGCYLCVALNGEHGVEGAYSAMKVDGVAVGAPNRAPSYPGGEWESPILFSNKNYTYYFPLYSGMAQAEIELYVFALKGNPTNFQPEVWITANPAPFELQFLTLI